MKYASSRSSLIAICFLVLFASRAAFSRGAELQPGDPVLDEMVQSFFLEEHAGRRRAIRLRIEDHANGSFDAVAKAVRRVNIWPEPTHATGEFDIHLPSGQLIHVSYRLPSDYNVFKAHPMIINQSHRTSGPSHALQFKPMESILRNQSSQFVVIYLYEAIEDQFHDTVDTGYDLTFLLGELRRMFRLDTNRTFLFIEDNRGVQYQWLMVAKHPDLFAGTISWSRTPLGMYQVDITRFLTHNLADSLWLWQFDTSKSPVLYAFTDRKSLDRALGLNFTAKKDNPNFKGQMSSDHFLSVSKKRPLRSIKHWFRYPGQGEVAWLKQTRFREPVWDHEQLAVKPGTPDVNSNDLIADTLKTLLAYMGAEVDGQTIDIQTRKCSRIEVTLPVDLVDLSKPVTIRINGQRRHHKNIRRSIRVLLDTAYRRWDFQNLAAARLEFSVRSDARIP